MEIWKPIPQYEGVYEASTHGRLRSLDRIVKNRWGGETRRPGKIIKQTIHHGGYCQVGLTSADGKLRNYFAHCLVALTFIGERPAGMDVCHWDGNSTNNQLDNLRYDTRVGNAADKTRHKTNNEGDTNPRATMTSDEVMGIYKRCKEGESQLSIAVELGMSPITVNHIASGRTWSSVTGNEWVRKRVPVTAALVRKINEILDSGKTLQDAADILGVSKPTVFRHSKNKSKFKSQMEGNLVC